MLSDTDRKKAADILMDAEKTHKQAVQLSTTWPNITIEDAYAISTEVANRKIAAGAKLIGHKVGLTSKAMQRSSQIDEPDYGHLFDYMMIPDGSKIAHATYCRPRVEIELAFILARQLKGPGIGLPEVLRATEYVVPAIEIVDARIVDPRKIFDTVVHAGGAGAERRHAARRLRSARRHRGAVHLTAPRRPERGVRLRTERADDRGNRTTAAG
jgi:2-oxo-hept-3-ene-1,7-dioate hydratase